MYSRTARLATYDRPTKFSKKRTSVQGKKKTTIPTWPHKTPTPDMLARAGFYFEPDDSEGDDNVKCFSCRANLNGWEADDNPAKEHISHRPDCNWAIVVSVADPDESRDPSSKELLRARIESYSHGPDWPHQGQCDIQHMAEAGFALDCDDENVDGATCHYCGVQLSGWEPEDDPWKEHEKRQPDCRFFELVGKHQEKPPVKRKKVSRKRATSKASRASVLSTVSNAVSEVARDLDDELTTEDSPDFVPKPKKTTRPRKNTKTQVDQPELVDLQLPIEVEKPAKKPRKTAKKSTKASMTSQLDEPATQITVQDDVEETDEQPVKKQRTTKGKKAVKKSATRVSDASTQLQAELDESLHSPEIHTKKTSKPQRGVKRSSDGSVVESDVSLMVGEFPLPPASSLSTTKPTRAQPQSRKQSRQKQSSSIPEQHDDDERLIELEFARIEAEQREREAKTKKQIPKDDFEIPQDEVNSEPVTAFSPAPITSNVSPSGSDKENDKSSLDNAAIEAVYMSPTKTSRLPLAPSTPNRTMAAQRVGTISPSKRLLGIAKSSEPWIPVDIENVLVVSSAVTPLRDQLVNQAGTLTTGERNMTVETWIRARASQAENELRRRGEEMVSVFEREGNRALSSLHGMRTA